MAKGKILVIEDNPQNRYLVTFLLEHHGYDITSAATGAEGLRIAATLRPHIILLDIHLPGMDGHDVARELKADPLLKDVPLVAVTAYAMAGDREKCFSIGIDGYIEKPIDPETFVKDVEKFIAGHAKEKNE